MNLEVSLAGLTLRTPLIAASGTVGAVYDFADPAALDAYGAAVAKSVSGSPWQGRPHPRMSPTRGGMLNGIGIQNPGIDEWREDVHRLAAVPVDVWGSAVGHDAAEFALVAKGLVAAGVAAVEINLSCPNLEGGGIFALSESATAAVVSAVRASVDLPIGAKLSPNSEDIVAIARAAVGAGVDFLVLTNTIWGLAIDPITRRPLLSGGIGGYSGTAIKPIALRCVWEVAQALPEAPIVGCGGVKDGTDVVEYLLAGATAVQIGTQHLIEPRAGRRILAEIDQYGSDHGVEDVTDLIGGAIPW